MYLCKLSQPPPPTPTPTGSKYCAGNPYFGHFRVPVWPWKWGQGHLNLINSSPSPNNVSMRVWSKSIHWFRKWRTETIFWTLQSASVTLEIRSRSSKSNQLVPSSKQYISASLVKSHPLFQKKTHGSQFRTFQSAAVTLKIRPISPKSNKLFPSIQQCIYASFVKIHRLVQKIMHGNESGRRRDPHQTNKPPLIFSLLHMFILFSSPRFLLQVQQTSINSIHCCVFIWVPIYSIPATISTLIHSCMLICVHIPSLPAASTTNLIPLLLQRQHFWLLHV